MFRKKCPKCGESISRKFEFCPFCGSNLRKIDEEKDYGMLGEDDNFNLDNELDRLSRSMFGGLGGGMLNKMLNNAIKMLGKEMQRETKELKNPEKIPKTNFQLFINGKKVNLDDLEEVPGFIHAPDSRKIKIPIRKPESKLPIPSEELIRKANKLPREEAGCKLKRLANKIIYEINVPGIKSLDKILINKLENSIEIKAFSKNKVFIKTLPINLPLIAYYLIKQKLFLEFQGK